ncbi:MAG: hypothetical protein PHW47_02320 [Lachnospira sp.]|nr:hypothetical protein [Lachnospira sp.]
MNEVNRNILWNEILVALHSDHQQKIVCQLSRIDAPERIPISYIL